MASLAAPTPTGASGFGASGSLLSPTAGGAGAGANLPALGGGGGGGRASSFPSPSQLSPSAPPEGPPSWTAPSALPVYWAPSTNIQDTCQRIIRCLKSIQEAEAKGRISDRSSTREATVLVDALRATPFGQVIEPAALPLLTPNAELTTTPANTVVQLRGAADALYVVLSGAAEVVAGPSKKVSSFTISIDSASGLIGDSEVDRLDPYIIVRMGGKEYKTDVAHDAGPNPVFNWSQTMTYNGESEIEIVVMEYDQFSKHDTLGLGTISSIDFTGAGGYDNMLKLSPGDVIRSQQAASHAASASLCANGGGSLVATGAASLVPSPAGSRAPSRPTTAPFPAIPATPDYGSVSITITWLPDVEASDANLGKTENLSLASTIPLDKSLNPLSTTSAFGASLKDTGALGAAKTGKKNSTRPLASSAEGQEWAGVVLGLGQHFGLEEGGGALRTTADCEFLMVPRADVSEAIRSASSALRNERDSLLRAHMPGMSMLDDRSFNTLAGAFHQLVLPRGHVLCRAGMPTGDARKVYIIKQGTCSIKVPPRQDDDGDADRQPGAGGSSGPESSRCGSPHRLAEEVIPRPATGLTALGILGPGAVLGYAASLFGTPEPFTVITEEPVSVFWIDVNQRPLSAWPKEVVFRLREALRLRTDWHVKRSHNVQASITSRGAALKIEGSGRMPALWTSQESPKLRHKELTLWRAETLRDRFDAEGWAGGPPCAFMSSSQLMAVSQGASLSAAHHGSGASTHGGSMSASMAASVCSSASVAGSVCGGSVCGGAGGPSLGGLPSPTFNSTLSASAVLNASAAAAGSASSLADPFAVLSPQASASAASSRGFSASRRVLSAPGLGAGCMAGGGDTARESIVSNWMGGGGAGSIATFATTTGTEDDGESPKFPKGPGCGLRGAPSSRGIYAVNSGLGRCRTPWGEWSPSGMLPPPARPAHHESWHGAAARARKKAVMKEDARNTDETSPRPGLSPSHQQESQDREAQRKKVNLKCPSELRRIAGVASPVSLGKMYRQQARSRALAGAFAPVAEGGGGGGSSGLARRTLGSSFSDSVLRRMP